MDHAKHCANDKIGQEPNSLTGLVQRRRKMLQTQYGTKLTLIRCLSPHSSKIHHYFILRRKPASLSPDSSYATLNLDYVTLHFPH